MKFKWEEKLILLMKKLVMRWRGFEKNSASPKKSVINPGVNSKIPDITTKKPSPKAFKRWSRLFKGIVLIRCIVLIPFLFIRTLPTMAVRTIRQTVSKGPTCSLTLRNM